MDVKELLRQAVLKSASDIFIVAGLPVSYRIEGVITRDSEEKLTPAQTTEYLRQIYAFDEQLDINDLVIPPVETRMANNTIHSRKPKLTWSAKRELWVEGGMW